ncbi:unnamed protein product [Rangifer tarandus platyrhynchus]|uniref:Uncharacterized protein n=2 Tax=Rangifer tarandus platyrhynchus TaxID=3082113 RepID=A0ABN8ZMI9_RANTA|nr:unnamed protein product [Rangifer tarandus platyrhynchus]CAI9707094.1 unnamed protein product [Rangifer tarandus platyrhynchus]
MQAEAGYRETTPDAPRPCPVSRRPSARPCLAPRRPSAGPYILLPTGFVHQSALLGEDSLRLPPGPPLRRSPADLGAGMTQCPEVTREGRAPSTGRRLIKAAREAARGWRQAGPPAARASSQPLNAGQQDSKALPPSAAERLLRHEGCGASGSRLNTWKRSSDIHGTTLLTAQESVSSTGFTSSTLLRCLQGAHPYIMVMKGGFSPAQKPTRHHSGTERPAGWRQTPREPTREGQTEELFSRALWCTWPKRPPPRAKLSPPETSEVSTRPSSGAWPLTPLPALPIRPARAALEPARRWWPEQRCAQGRRGREGCGWAVRRLRQKETRGPPGPASVACELA